MSPSCTVLAKSPLTLLIAARARSENRVLREVMKKLCEYWRPVPSRRISVFGLRRKAERLSPANSGLCRAGNYHKYRNYRRHEQPRSQSCGRRNPYPENCFGHRLQRKRCPSTRKITRRLLLYFVTYSRAFTSTAIERNLFCGAKVLLRSKSML